MCMGNILRMLLRWHHPDTDHTVTQVVETAAPNEMPLGATVSVEMEHAKAPEPSETPEVPDVAPEAPEAMGGSNLPPATAGLPHEP
jgi:hypothetical protein